MSTTSWIPLNSSRTAWRCRDTKLESTTDNGQRSPQISRDCWRL